MPQWSLGNAVEAVATVVVVAVVAGQLLGQPILIGYVTSGSMEPTLDAGDGFVAVPDAITGEIDEGDVIVFEAETLSGGGLTTHRVVDITDRGYITKGDANPFTDQDGQEPPIKEAQVVAEAWRPGGRVLVIPALGTAVMRAQLTIETVQTRAAAALGTRSLLGTQGLTYLLGALSVVAYLLDVALGSAGGRDRGRDTSRASGTSVHLLLGVFAAAVVLAATASMVVPAGSQQFGFVSAVSDSPGPRVIEQGTTESFSYPVGNGGYVPVIIFLEPGTDRVNATPAEFSVPARSSLNATVSLSAPPETGYYRQYLVQYRYLAVLPQSTIRTLHAVHPWLPILVIDGVLGGSFYLLGFSLVGTGRVHSRGREGSGLFSRLG